MTKVSFWSDADAAESFRSEMRKVRERSVVRIEACTTCGADGPRCNFWRWWLRLDSELLCEICAAIAMSDDTDHGDEHVETEAVSVEFHEQKIEHQTRQCRVCIRRMAPLRPDVRWRDSAALPDMNVG